MLFYALIKREKAFIGKLIGFKTCKQRIAEAGMDIFVKLLNLRQSEIHRIT